MKKTLSKKKLTKGQWGFIALFGIPPFLLFLYITFYPMINSFVMSFFNSGGDKFVGFANYKSVFSESGFFAPMLNDFLILILKEIMVVVLALFFAVSITRLGLGKAEMGFLRFIYYIPNILSVVVTAKVWKYFFDFNLFGKLFGISMPSNGWINEYPVLIITFVAGWCGIGAFMIILIAAINNVSKELYEAAEIEGAGQMRQLFAITLPSVLPQVRYIAVTVVISLVASNTNFVKLFMGDSSGGSGFTVMGVYEYNAFDREQFDRAYPAAVIIMLIVFAVSWGLNKLIREKEEN